MSISVPSTINAALSAKSAAAVQDVAPASAPSGTQSGSSASALYLNLGIAEVNTGPLGLRTPQNPEDSAALLAAVELMLNKTTDKIRGNTIEAHLGAAQLGAKLSIKAASDAQATLQTAKDTLKSDQDQLTTAQGTQQALETQSTNLGGEITTLQAVIADLQAKVAEGKDPTAAGQLAAAQGQMQSLVTAKQGVDQHLSEVDAQIGTLETAIATLETETIPNDEAQVQTRAAAVAAAFSQLAVSLQATNGDRQVSLNTSADKSVRLELGFEDLQATAAKFRDNASAVDKEEAAHRADTDDRAVNNLVLGLVAGIADALSVLKQAVASPAGAPSDAAKDVRDRLRFAL